MTTYPHERQIEYWVSRAIEDYFDNQGYDVVVLPNSNRAENAIPYDHLFAGRGVKVFGLQYKRLCAATEDYWRIDTRQLQRLCRFGWIYYALPQITSISQHRNALHLIAVAKSASLSRKIAQVNAHDYKLRCSELGLGSHRVPYCRWGGFVQRLFACTEGWRPTSKDELRSVLLDPGDLVDTLTDIYVVSLNTKGARLALRISPFITDVQGTFDYDFGLGWDTD